VAGALSALRFCSRLDILGGEGCGWMLWAEAIDRSKKQALQKAWLAVRIVSPPENPASLGSLGADPYR
jgi:hypothetical protein